MKQFTTDKDADVAENIRPHEQHNARVFGLGKAVNELAIYVRFLRCERALQLLFGERFRRPFAKVNAAMVQPHITNEIPAIVCPPMELSAEIFVDDNAHRKPFSAGNRVSE